jgi:hypothetical protein
MRTPLAGIREIESVPLADGRERRPLQSPYMPTKAIKRTRPKLQTSTTRKKRTGRFQRLLGQT